MHPHGMGVPVSLAPRKDHWYLSGKKELEELQLGLRSEAVCGADRR